MREGGREEGGEREGEVNLLIFVMQFSIKFGGLLQSHKKYQQYL